MTTSPMNPLQVSSETEVSLKHRWATPVLDKLPELGTITLIRPVEIHVGETIRAQLAYNANLKQSVWVVRKDLKGIAFYRTHAFCWLESEMLLNGVKATMALTFGV
jgi:hypothetical protein